MGPPHPTVGPGLPYPPPPHPAACGAETPTPETPLAPLTLWGRVEEAAKNFSDRLWGSDVGQTVQ